MEKSSIFGSDFEEFSKGIVERGFFPENLPPVFSVSNLYAAAEAHIVVGNYISKKPSESAVYNCSKRGGSRRIFAVPNPCFSIDSAIFIYDKKDSIFEHFSASKDSLSVPNFSSTGRPVKITNHADFHRIRRQRLATSRYVVRTDISRYYHSIYTHSIPWALHGKVASKKDRKVESQHIFGNRLDQIVRQSQDGQTVGIPVGPDASRYISEIIGKAIDFDFRSKHDDQHIMIRHVDDIFIGADDLDSASNLLSGIRESIRKFQLDINENKTSILQTTQDLEDFWPVRIRREIQKISEDSFFSSGSNQAHDLVYLLDDIIRTANIEGDDGVIKYALRRIDEAKIWDDFWYIFQPFLIRSAVNFPHCWDYISRIVTWRSQNSDLDKNLWSTVIDKSARENSKFGNDSEICWALWLAKMIKVPISLDVVETIIEKCGPLSVLMTIDVYEGCDHPFKFPKSKIIERLGDQPMLGEDWILAYEADRQFGFKLKTKNQNGFPFVDELYENSVQFYDREAVLGGDQQGKETGDEEDTALGDIHSFYDNEEDEVETETGF